MCFLKIFPFLFIAFLLLTSGIGRDDVKPEKHLKLAQQKQFDCVGRVYIDGEASGSCVLICESVVLSAAHVFIQSDTRLDTMEMAGQKVIVYVPINEKAVLPSQVKIEYNGVKYGLKQIHLHPVYTDSIGSGACDLAYLELDQPVKGVSPALINNKFDELGNEVTGVGFGVIGQADKPELVINKAAKYAGQNVIDSIGGEMVNGYQSLLFCDMDSPDLKGCNKMGSGLPRPLEYICGGGDSGGGLFTKQSDKWVLVGICSGSPTDINQLNQTGYYGQTMFWTRVSPFIDWIEEQIAKG